MNTLSEHQSSLEHRLAVIDGVEIHRSCFGSWGILETGLVDAFAESTAH